jgi:hypothetical protein
VSLLRRVVSPQASKQEKLDVAFGSPVGGMTRRGVVRRALVTGAGAALAAAGGSSLADAQDATPVSTDEASTIETASGQALYSLPRDHRWHGGPFYTTAEYWEWHYWTGLVTDVDSGDEWGLFYTCNDTQYAPGDSALDE